MGNKIVINYLHLYKFQLNIVCVLSLDYIKKTIILTAYFVAAGYFNNIVPNDN